MVTPVSQPPRTAAVQRVLWAVLVANLGVIVIKLGVGLRSGSIAVLGDAAHSGVDLLNNVVGLLAIRAAAQPPDEEHPYGHAKFETIGALAIVGFLSITCYELVEGAVGRLVRGGAGPRVDAITLSVLGSAMVVNVGVAWIEARKGHELNSAILLADARHTAADVLVTVSVIGGLILVRLGWPSADAWLAIVVAALVARSGYQIVRHTVPVLVDRRAVEADRVRRFVESVPGVRKVSDVRSRGRLPADAFVELTVQVDRQCSVEEGHAIADRVQTRLEREAGFAAAVVHIEPHGEAAGDQPG